MAADEQDLDELLDDALEDFGDLKVTPGAHQKESSGPKEDSKPQKSAFDPLGRANRKNRKAKSVKPKAVAEASRTVEETLPVPGASAASEEDDGVADGLIDKLAEQFAGGLEDNGELQSMVDSVMRQLLSKEVLYEPLREISAKYPKWLEENESKISKEDFDRYTKQLQCIKRLCTFYESSSNKFDDVLHLMQEIQSCGQPPDEIIHELAPDLEVGPDGVPVGGAGAKDPLQIFGGMDKSAGCPIQ
mmetsp:Transcript_8921/g.16581  ORF Transcript_8921/g.16581 Transcript_8921/m.16581 type:complete len:246 (+) Transcript_8921:88-825(+)